MASCVQCGEPYEPVIKTQRFDTDACRITWWRLRMAKARELLDLLDEDPETPARTTTAEEARNAKA